MPANSSTLPINLTELLESWKIVLRAQRKAESTFRSYTTGVERYIAWCYGKGENPALDRNLVNMWVAELLDSRLEANTVKARQLAIRRFSAWLDSEDDIPYIDQLLGIKPPKLTEKLIQPLTEKELKLLILACERKSLRDRRYEAVIRLMAQTGLRPGEVTALKVSDVNVSLGVASVQKSKNGRGRVVPFSPKTAMAIDKYLRLRRSHPLADTGDLWLGERGRVEPEVTGQANTHTSPQPNGGHGASQRHRDTFAPA